MEIKSNTNGGDRPDESGIEESFSLALNISCMRGRPAQTTVPRRSLLSFEHVCLRFALRRTRLDSKEDFTLT